MFEDHFVFVGVFCNDVKTNYLFLKYPKNLLAGHTATVLFSLCQTRTNVCALFPSPELLIMMMVLVFGVCRCCGFYF